MAGSLKKTSSKKPSGEDWTGHVSAAFSVLCTGLISATSAFVGVVSLMGSEEWSTRDYFVLAASVFFTLGFALVTYLTTLSAGWTTID